MIPLFPHASIFHSYIKSKSLYSSFVTMSPLPSVTVLSKYSSPLAAFQRELILSLLKVRHPSVVLPSNRSFQPSFCSLGVSVFWAWDDTDMIVNSRQAKIKILIMFGCCMG